MKVGSISTINQKGQVVIPALIRTQLGISNEIPLHISVRGNVIHIVPITDVLTLAHSDSSYLDLLKKTQGAWAKDSDNSLQTRALELEASQERKKSW